MHDLKQVFELRAQRLKLQKEVDTLEQQEKDILYEIQKEMSAAGLTTYSMDGYTSHAKPKEVPLVTDWPALLDYIRQTGEVDMLQKRVTDSAVKLRWDNGVYLPGVEKSTRTTITVTKD